MLMEYCSICNLNVVFFARELAACPVRCGVSIKPPELRVGSPPHSGASRKPNLPVKTCHSGLQLNCG